MFHPFRASFSCCSLFRAFSREDHRACGVHPYAFLRLIKNRHVPAYLRIDDIAIDFPILLGGETYVFYERSLLRECAVRLANHKSVVNNVVGQKCYTMLFT